MFMPFDKTLEMKKLGLSEEIESRVSRDNNEPEWMLQFRLDAFQQLLTMEEPKGPGARPLISVPCLTIAITSDHHRLL